jgi:glycerophosphoryl diester phosphodiesterase
LKNQFLTWDILKTVKMNINRLFLLTGFQIRHDADQFIYHLQSHRGYCQDPEIRENTLAALKKSYELGYQMVEFDVRLTKDHQVVLFHDDHIEGHKISDLNLTQLNQIIQVDLLKDVFRWYQTIESSKFKLNIEIKSKVINGSVEFFVYRLIQDFKMQKNILISSFNPFFTSIDMIQQFLDRFYLHMKKLLEITF